LAPVGTLTTPHGAPVVRVLVAPRAQLHAIQGGAGRLLTVREVADRLAVSTATVYALCERGELAHVRISNAIRIEPTGLEAFISTRRT
jgi:excisionase family DNA binding protein